MFSVATSEHHETVSAPTTGPTLGNADLVTQAPEPKASPETTVAEKRTAEIDNTVQEDGSGSAFIGIVAGIPAAIIAAVVLYARLRKQKSGQAKFASMTCSDAGSEKKAKQDDDWSTTRSTVSQGKSSDDFGELTSNGKSSDDLSTSLSRQQLGVACDEDRELGTVPAEHRRGPLPAVYQPSFMAPHRPAATSSVWNADVFDLIQEPRAELDLDIDTISEPAAAVDLQQIGIDLRPIGELENEQVIREL